MIDFIVELILDIIGEGVAEGIKNSKIPKIIRIVLLSILCVPLIILCCISSKASLAATGTVGFCITLAIAAVILALWVFGIIKILKK